jgi:hypothetical protein
VNVESNPEVVDFIAKIGRSGARHYQPCPVVSRHLVHDNYGAIVDTAEHALSVWPVDTRSAAGRVWREGLEELAEAEAAGDWEWAPQVWAYVGRSRVARGVPDGTGALRFRFRSGDPVYKELTTARRMSAAVVVDRTSARLMYVRFRVRK